MEALTVSPTCILLAPPSCARTALLSLLTLIICPLAPPRATLSSLLTLIICPLAPPRAALSSLLTLIEDDAPVTPLDRQHVQSTLELITEGLLPWVDDMTPQLLVGTLCLLAKLRYYDGPLLARLMQAPQQRGGILLASFKPWQASGMLWALGRCEGNDVPPCSALTCDCVPHCPSHLPIPPFPGAQPHVNCPKITCVLRAFP